MLRQGLEHYHAIRENGQSELRLNLAHLETEMFRGSSPAYILLEALEIVQAEPAQSHKDLPRILLSILGTLDRLCGNGRLPQHNWSDELCRDLWNRIKLGYRYDWSISKVVQVELEQLLPEAAASIRGLTQPSLNLTMRRAIGPHLQTSSDLSLKLANWIIKRWGGIKRLDSNKLALWLERLGDFSEVRVSSFTEQMQGANISSWSKLLAFQNCEQHAIYDARTSVALNCILADLGHPPAFFMPLGQNRTISAARQRLLPLQPAALMFYTEDVRGSNPLPPTNLGGPELVWRQFGDKTAAGQTNSGLESLSCLHGSGTPSAHP